MCYRFTMTTNKRATAHVFRNLRREISLWKEAGETFSTESQEVFTEQATWWLGDHTELSTRTIESANWTEVFEHYRDLRESETT